MKAGPIWPHSAYPVTSGKVFPRIDDQHQREGLGLMASLNGDAIWRLGFHMPPVVPKVGDPKLRLTAIADPAGSTSYVVDANVKWASVELADTRVSITTEPNEWLVNGTNEYYHTAAQVEPCIVYLDGMPAVRGTTLVDPGEALNAGEWDYLNLGGNDTVCVRTSDSADPDTKGTSYVQISNVAENPAPGLNAEGPVSFCWLAGSDSGDKYITAYIPLDADDVISAEEISMDLTFEVPTGRTILNVASTWYAAIVWE